MSNATDNSTGAASAATGAKHHSIWSRLYHCETTFDFVGRRRIGFAVSGFLIVVTLISLFARGLNLGLDFKGGVAWNAPANAALTLDAAKSILTDNGLTVNDAKIQTLNSNNGKRIRLQVGAQPAETQAAVRNALAAKAGVEVQEVSLDSVSATWGDEITKKAIKALVVFFLSLIHI